MQIILKEAVHGLGEPGQIVNVKPGYARNYLIPQGKASSATPAALKQYEETVRQRKHKEEKLHQDALELAARMEGIRLSIGAKASGSGKIFGSVNNIQIAEALEGKGFTIDRKRITLPPAVRELGSYKATIHLHKEVSVDVDFDVVSE